jgi:hypothetical protein
LHAGQGNPASIGKNDLAEGGENPGLALGDLGRIVSDERGPSWNHREAFMNRVENRAGDTCHDHARQIAVDFAEQNGRNHRARHEDRLFGRRQDHFGRRQPGLTFPAEPVAFRPAALPRR